ncbi:MAG: hypothetical protein ABI969_18230 [bacterium]
MSTPEISVTLRTFVDHHMMTVDHVALLLDLRAQPAVAQTPAALAKSSRLDRDVVDRVLADLLDAQLIRRDGQSYLYSARPQLTAVVDELAHMYTTMPVTLIRAIYARPDRAAKSFAAAFRLRKEIE